ncbi:MAG: hypothetical protein JSR15_01760, partial [Proteobacteria bacterium]|nr:hypothetical protein [Pseudomonadota bacterium]
MPRLTKPVYESMPGAYIALGAALLWASYRWREESWGTPCMSAGFIVLVLGLVLWMHRRAYRATSADYQRRGRPLVDPG